MAASRRGPPPLSVWLPQPSAAAILTDLPPISALFLIDFDVKAGYTIVWKQAVPGLELEGTVEYKSLPSGLHTVSDDLIYFVHDGGHAGLSAFVNRPTDEEETRHARMIAVGVLVPLSYGRLGRAWRHAEGLKTLAAKLAGDRTQTQLLDDYWEKHAVRETTAPQPLKDTPLESPVLSIKASRPGLGKGHVRNRSASDGAALIPPGHRLSPFHPAWSLTSLLDTFGPLIFPIHRAALLRKRILISCHAPVHEVCNFVYDISVLSNIPVSVCDVIDPSAPVQRLRPLFSVGVHDISHLLEHQAGRKRSARGNDHNDSSNVDDAGSGWVACTTDSILAMKEGLWDMLITMPPPYTFHAKHRVWPTVECPKGVPVKATQRDLRRFRSLTLGLRRLAVAQTRPHPQPPNARSPPSETSDSPVPTTPAIRLSKPSSASRPGTAATEDRPSTLSAVGNGDDTDKIVEPTTWAALAYNGFMWWASAGEKRHSEEIDEQSHDAALLEDLMAPAPASPVMGGGPSSPSQQPGAQGQRRSSFGAAASSSSGMGIADSLASLAGHGGDGAGDEDDENARAQVQLAVVAYFHRLTTSVLSVLADIVDSSEDDDDDDLLDVDVDTTAEFDGPAPSSLLSGAAHDRSSREEEARLLGGSSRGWVRVDSQALAEMGLDVWSQADADFVRELAARYFSRRAYVETKGVEICGVRVC
ncbi:hypothetical protein C8A03DRAFT_29360 [Achaetomium macrosporum]|uniref:DUF4484 domain-containing protein n=1 Tax=Achaetomium macrosporum TaxID=79813 RepID=A0AAN7CI11_9PEZI|nr:hypothetical protein C8A03DRAFT_29360 [Achaetomium macrosporum]